MSLAFAQSGGGQETDSLRGTVINSVTCDPIGRALVSSPDNRFATMTDSEGHFEFTFAKVEPPSGNDTGTDGGNVQVETGARPDALMARKPGFIPDQYNPVRSVRSRSGAEVILPLTPEALITGTVTLPTSEAPDSIFLQIYRRQVQEGRAHWVPAGGTQSKSDGEFRFADLPAGTYKLLTRELLDRDPLTATTAGQQYGYPPAYSQNAPDFESAGTIRVSPGETGHVELTLSKQPYYHVRIGVANVSTEMGVNVNVYAVGRKGPGFSLGYNNRNQAIEGLLPDGTYTVEAASFGPNASTGLMTLTIKGRPVDGARMTMVPSTSIPVIVNEQFTADDHTGSVAIPRNGRSVTQSNPRRYLNLWLDPDEDFERGAIAGLRNPMKAGDDALVIENVRPGRYWVQVNSSRGYAASVRSGNLDLLRQPLVVGTGGSSSPIEVTMRDDTAEINGTVEGITTTPKSAAVATTTIGAVTSFAGPEAVDPSPAHIYCIPLPDSPGQFSDIWVAPDGSFTSPPLAPGAYRILAFDRPQRELEYRNPEAMSAYDSKGPVVRVSGGQKETVRLQLISTSER